ncbi:hypothetical protein [Capnocytophaga felis]|uniref:Outer membrane protein beta-barrel domain-containing protein n=1 Tax=Capnocytophaga felis TaxID=2267611 RepID=A0A5M4BB04_9FLAO|nr:hypothetical protein [Capnocytophaga felis]GET46610.1 hypothetical protein RCZ01_19120 [Capnocytophaga felis]GET49084.1 hypothetical protein RCZ02_19150 [Capnocytophaga felis]
MKKFILGVALVLGAVIFNNANAQIQKGNWMVGGQVANMKFTNGLNIHLTPQAGYFVADNFVVGGLVDLNVFKVKGSSDTQTNWNVGGFGRYYVGKDHLNLLKNGRFFGEGSFGFGGNNSSSGSTTNGVDLGIGAGYAYFITRNVSLDAMLKFNAVVGGGNTSGQGDLGLRIGFQIFLPTSKVKAALNDK